MHTIQYNIDWMNIFYSQQMTEINRIIVPLFHFTFHGPVSQRMSSLVEKSIFHIFPMLLDTVYGGLERAYTISNIASIGCSFQKLLKKTS